MSPEQAKVFIAEDDDFVRGIVKKSLVRGGHEVSIVASNLEEAIEAVDQLALLRVQVAIVDGNLSKDKKSGEDGKAIIKAIRIHAPDVKIIGFSSNKAEGVEGADVDICKSSGVTELVTAVDEL